MVVMKKLMDWGMMLLFVSYDLGVVKVFCD